jgi:hypothetical protein
MKLKNALPASVNHHAATKLVEKQMNTIADAAIGQQTAPQQTAQRFKAELPRPRGPNDHSRPKNVTLLAIDTKGLLLSGSFTDGIADAIAVHSHVD